MSTICLSKEEKKRVVTTMKMGKRADRMLKELTKKMGQEREKNLEILKRVEQR